MWRTALRRISARSIGVALASSAIGASSYCGGALQTQAGSGEADYAAALSSISTLPPAITKGKYGNYVAPSNSTSAVRAIAAENLVALKAHDGSKQLPLTEALYQLRALTAGRPNYLCCDADVDQIPSQAAVVLVVRGADAGRKSGVAKLSDAAIQAFTAAAAADTYGYTWYIISDSTPDDRAEYAQKILNIEIPESSLFATQNTPPAPPLIALFDHIDRTGTKYFMPLPYSENDATKALAAKEASLSEMLDAAVPTPGDILQWLGDHTQGKLQPTLLGLPRPEGDAHPVFPFLKVVVSDSFDDVVIKSPYDVVLEAYLTDCPMCMALGARIRMLAYLASKYFPHVSVAAMNVDDNDRPRSWLPGPAFPTLQLFNAGTNTPYTKQFGPGCPHITSPSDLMGAVNPVPMPPSVRAVESTGAGTPACVPSMSFAHPSNEGKSAIPTVPEMVYWVARYGSRGFDPAATPLHPRDVSVHSGESLLSLAENMEKDARALESCIFQLFYVMSIAETYGKLFGASPLTEQLLGLVSAAKKQIVDQGMYGTVPAAEAALDACDAFVDEHNMLTDVRAHYADEKEKKLEQEAIAVAKSLLQ